MLSWVFGNSKKKEPMVTIDPRPIDDFHVITTPQNPAPSPSSHLYPDLSGSTTSLPYPSSPRPNPGHVPHLQRANSGPEVQNQLESVPFQLDSQLQDSGVHSSSANDWRELSRTFRRSRQHLDNGEFDYDFSLERRVLNEERMANGLDSLVH